MSSKKTNPDQSLSDQQMDEIMEELEQLEKEIDDQDGDISELKVVPDEDGMEGFRGSSSDASMEETLGHLKEEDGAAENCIFDETEKTAPAVESSVSPEGEGQMSKQSGSGQDELKMTLSGQMKLVLEMQSDGHSVSVSFDSGHLVVEMSDGTEFKIPLNRSQKSHLKAV